MLNFEYCRGDEWKDIKEDHEVPSNITSNFWLSFLPNWLYDRDALVSVIEKATTELKVKSKMLETAQSERADLTEQLEKKNEELEQANQRIEELEDEVESLEERVLNASEELAV